MSSDMLLSQILNQSVENSKVLASSKARLDNMSDDIKEIKDRLEEGDKNFSKLMPFMEKHVIMAVERRSWKREIKARTFTGLLVLITVAIGWFGRPFVAGLVKSYSTSVERSQSSSDR